MSDTEAPVTETVAPETPTPAPTEAPAPEQAPNESDAAYRRRIIEAARHEKRAVAAQREAQTRAKQVEEAEKRLAEREAKIDEAVKRIEAFESLRKRVGMSPKDTREAMAALGLDLDTAVQSFLGDEPTPDMRLRDAESRLKAELDPVAKELADLKKKIAEREAKEAESQQRANQQALLQEIQSVVSKDPDRYELILAEEQQSEVFELMRLAYQERGVVLEVDKAADMLEDFLLQQANDRAAKWAKSKKLGTRFAPPPPPETPAAPKTKQAPDAREPKASTTTLSAKLATSPAQPEAEETTDMETLTKRAADKVKAAREAKRAK